MSMYDVETRNVDGAVTALGSAGPFTLSIDRSIESGGGGRGFSGGQLLHLAVAACVSNDLFREATSRGITLARVVVRVDGGYEGDPAVSTGITYGVECEGDASREDLHALVRHVDEIAEIPNSLRDGTAVTMATVEVRHVS
jgi:putative redox protein